MTSGEGNRFALEGEYREIRAPERLVYSWVWQQGGMAGFETVVTLELLALGPAETELRVRHELFPDATWRERHAFGWGGGLDRLAARIWQEGDAHGRPVVFGVPFSSFTRIVCMALHEKGIEFSFEKAVPHSDEQRARHPFGRIPAFAHGGAKLFETLAICRYVDEALPGPALQPADPLERARMQQWISASTDYVARTIAAPIVFERLFKPRLFGQPSDEAAIRDALPRAEATLAALEAGLADSPYFAGEFSTLADFFLFPTLDYAAGTPDLEARIAALPRLTGWLGKMRTRPSARATEPRFD
jgi:glutathione S-transferase